MLAEDLAVLPYHGAAIIPLFMNAGPSWLDGKPSIIMDYSATSRVWADVRDEVREVAGSFVLGALPPAEAEAVRAHLETCQDAHAEIRELGGRVRRCVR